MKKFHIKFAGMSSLGMALVLASCGGGGGDPGTPLFPSASKLTMTPNISGVTLVLGQYSEPVKISGGEPPYYTGATGGVVSRLLDDGTLYIQAVAVDNTNAGTDSSTQGCSSSDYVWIQDSSYNQTQLKFDVCVTAAVAVTSTGVFDVIPPTQALSSLSQSVSYTLVNGVGPYYVSVPTYTATATSANTPTTNLVSVSPMSMMSNTTPLVVKPLACVKGDYAVPLTVTDTASGTSTTVTVQLLNDDTGSGCY